MTVRCSQAGPQSDPRGGMDRRLTDGTNVFLPYPPAWIEIDESLLPEDRTGWLIGQDGHTYGDSEPVDEATRPKRKRG